MRSPDSVAAPIRHQRRESESSSRSCSDSEHKSENDEESRDGHPSIHPHPHAKDSGSWLQKRRMAVAREIKRDREQRVIHLHQIKARHYVDHCFSFFMGNLAVVSLVLGVVYRQRACDKPLAAFLVILGCLAPFAACTPILVRQWFYLHLRCNVMATVVYFMTFLSTVWLLVGQQWTFASSPVNCDDDLSMAANVVAFLMFTVTLAYAAKVAWYLLLRALLVRRALALVLARPVPGRARGLRDGLMRARGDRHLDARVGSSRPRGQSVGNVTLRRIANVVNRAKNAVIDE